jgi:drug/metabolite transporter (DMT)-like permease
VDAVLLACTSALLFGGMTVALRHPLARGVDPVAGALHTVVPAILVTLPFVAATGVDVEGLWPFVVAGLLAPGVSQLLFTFAIRDAGPSRTSVVVGTAPLFAVAIALVVLDEPLEVALVSGALLIVLGGILLASERSRPGHVKVAGLVAALAATVVFAFRDNLVRWLADDSDTAVQPALAAATTLTAGMLVVAGSLLVRVLVRDRLGDGRRG